MDLLGMTTKDATQAFDGAFAGFADTNGGFEAVLIGKAISNGCSLRFTDFGVPQGGVFALGDPARQVRLGIKN